MPGTHIGPEAGGGKSDLRIVGGPGTMDNPASGR
jgi:hypothetical protein